ncbi:MAG TPA: UDP-3-O-(3-hydroxymyristoyl)glucosamine N-acyltransferase [Candidatus Acidoferrales bacterium]
MPARKTVTAAQIAEAIGAQIEGNAEHVVSGLRAPESAAAGDLIYVESEKHAERARQSAAMCVIAPPRVSLPGKTVLHTPQPKLAFARAAALVLPEPARIHEIHTTAVVAPGVRLGPRVSIGAHAVVEEGVEIGAETVIDGGCVVGRGCCLGENCRLHPRVVLYPGAKLGDRVEVHAGAVIGSDGFGYVQGEGRHWKFPQVGGVEIGDDVEIGANSTIDRGSLGTTRIAAGVKIDNLVHVAHNVEIGVNTLIAAQTGISGSSRIGANVILAGQVGIADGVTIEDEAIVGAQGGVLPGKTIRKGQTVWGTPARPLAEFKRQFAWLARQSKKG